MAKKYRGAVVVLVFLLLLIGISIWVGKEVDEKKTAETPVPLTILINEVMKACNSTVKGPARVLLTGQIARIAMTHLESRAHQEAFIMLLCIESRFERRAVSKVGAIGLAQIMPQYATEFANRCNIPGSVTTEDLVDNEVNLHIGACAFSSLLRKYNGNVALALSAYNSGTASSTTKKLQKLQGNLNKETSEYITRFFTLKQQLIASQGD